MASNPESSPIHACPGSGFARRARPGMTECSGTSIMAAYGLYTHIASNKFRSMLLLGGLFLLIYVMVFAGALIAEVLLNGDGTVAYYLSAALRDLLKAFPWATIGAALWV